MEGLEMGRFSDDDLEEMVDGDVHGGTTWVCATVTLISAIGCPTTRCTETCPRP